MVAALALPVVLDASPASAAQPCWKRLVNDWFDGQIQGAYPIPCYRQAIDNLPADVDIYSSARDDITRALQAALLDRKNRVKGNEVLPAPTTTGTDTSGGGAASGGGPTGGGGGSGAGPTKSTKGGGRSGGGGLADIGPNKADEFPLPLIILAAIAFLLVVAGAAALLARRMQARRPRALPEGAPDLGLEPGRRPLDP